MKNYNKSTENEKYLYETFFKSFKKAYNVEF